ncbi:MAG TPA: FtsQ-type POTRA domain-containing protein [Gemmatimonadales bacterium]|jgi:cell division septal protein FtsQ|nr:FtsQ-type POTRA domain-containing protein [Gemmatimonadales bacterium]
MSRRVWIVCGAALAVLLLAGFGTPRVLRRLSFFRVREVEVVGARYLDEDAVVRQLRLAANASTFDKLDQVRLAARAIPGVLAVTVERRLPGAIRVTIREAVPVALTPTADHLLLIDARGHVLPFDPARAPASLPVSDRDSAAAALLDRLRLVDPEGYAQVETAHVDHGDIVLDDGPHRVRFRPDASTDMLRSVAAVRTYLESHTIPWREMDARYQARVFVRKGKA